MPQTISKVKDDFELWWLYRWCIFRPTQICYTSLLTYEKSAILQLLNGLVAAAPGPYSLLAAALGPDFVLT